MMSDLQVLNNTIQAPFASFNTLFTKSFYLKNRSRTTILCGKYYHIWVINYFVWFYENRTIFIYRHMYLKAEQPIVFFYAFNIELFYIFLSSFTAEQIVSLFFSFVSRTNIFPLCILLKQNILIYVVLFLCRCCC